MDITYAVEKCEMVRGMVETFESYVFCKVEDAVEFHKKQLTGAFSWWEIRVLYK